jgi:hypothetical protein
MNAGRIDQIGTPHEVYHTPKTRFVAGFIGSPTMNMLPCRLVENGSGLTVRLSEWLSFPVPPSRVDRYRPRVGDELIFGLRPEHIIEERGDAPPGTAAFEARLDVVEPMGMRPWSTRRRRVEVCNGSIPQVGRAGESMRLAADPCPQIYLTDPRTERSFELTTLPGSYRLTATTGRASVPPRRLHASINSSTSPRAEASSGKPARWSGPAVERYRQIPLMKLRRSRSSLDDALETSDQSRLVLECRRVPTRTRPPERLAGVKDRLPHGQRGRPVPR